MRKIDAFADHSQAEQVRHMLRGHGIETRDGGDDPEGIWVLADDDLPKARRLVGAFRQSPEPFASDIAAGAEEKDREEKNARRREAEHQRLDRILRKSGTPVTLGLVITCTLLFLLTLFEPLRIIKYILMFPPVRSVGDIPLWQYWRMVTPILLHGGIFHIMFNMMWVYSVGPLVESRLSTWQMLGLVVLIGLVSNVTFFHIAGPNFLGMSGVIYGFIGFLWASDRINPHPQITLDPGTFKFFMIWYVICWVLSGLSLFPIANTIHGVGALVGIVYGFFANGYWKKVPLTRLFGKESAYTVALVAAMAVGGVVVDLVVYGQ